MNIGEANRRVVINTWSTTTDAGGGVNSVIASSYSIWAKVEDRSGNLVFSQQQETWNYDYKITMRFEKSRVITTDKTITYDGKSLRINSAAYANEGNKREVICRCSTITK